MTEGKEDARENALNDLRVRTIYNISRACAVLAQVVLDGGASVVKTFRFDFGAQEWAKEPLPDQYVKDPKPELKEPAPEMPQAEQSEPEQEARA